VTATKAPLTYAAAGVDIAAADEAKARIKALVESTRTAGCVGGFGSFGGLFRAPGASGQILVASADGVGTKIKVAIEAGRHDTVGHCLVNHCVNDILAQGATPLFFLDYVAFGTLRPDVSESVVRGVAAGCRENGCALLGGETAEMPGLYSGDDYDLAGFIVGAADERHALGADRVRVGDMLVALGSSGLHTNGYSLARRIVSERLRLAVDDAFPGEGGATVADVLLRVHRSYLATIRPVLESVHALAHITGGGIPGNLNRVLPLGADAAVDATTWTVPNVFRVLGEAGQVAPAEMFHALNMGVGAIVVAATADVAAILASAAAHDVRAWTCGEVVSGSGKVQLTGVST
jgi:phosphoribosylformylglycinamidine cyclo-ligase